MTRRFSRRGLFGSAALLATLPAFARVDGPDRELVALCGAFIAECDRFDTAAEAANDDDAACARALHTAQAAWTRQLDRMEQLRAMTPEGIQARALALHRYNGMAEHSYEHPGSRPARLLAYLLRDAAALGGAA